MLNGETVFLNSSDDLIYHTPIFSISGKETKTSPTIWMREKIGRIVISVGILLAILIATAVTLTFTVFNKTIENGQQSPNTTIDKTITERLSQVVVPKSDMGMFHSTSLI